MFYHWRSYDVGEKEHTEGAEAEVIIQHLQEECLVSGTHTYKHTEAYTHM